MIIEIVIVIIISLTESRHTRKRNEITFY